MDSITIVLEFEAENREEIEKDIWSNDRNFVDFNILRKCPEELESQVSGLNEEEAIEIVKNHNKTFNIEDEKIRDNIKCFIEKYKEESDLLSSVIFHSGEKNMNTIINSIIAYQKYGYGNWYQFKLNEWGVSHNAFEFGKKRRTKNGGFYFVCGGIPTKWLAVLSAKWPDISFKMFYRMQFYNIQRNENVFVLTYKNGKQISRKQVERSF